jgi:cell division protein FtsB
MEDKKQTKLEKIYDYALQFRDVRAAGLMLFLVVVLLISWSGLKVIDTNYRLQQQIAQLEQQTEVHRLSNINTKLQNDYYQTDQYLEITARQNFGLAKPGETLLNVSSDVALRHTVDLPDEEKIETKKTTSKQPAYQRNFQAWINFLLHRQQLDRQST